MRITTEMYEDVHKYMEQWADDENWTDLNVALEEGHTDLAAHILVGSGAINPTWCYPEYKKLEEIIITLANRFRKLSRKNQDAIYDSVFRVCFIASCNSCGHVSFVNCGNEELYPELKTICWSCCSKDIDTYFWKKRGIK